MSKTLAVRGRSAGFRKAEGISLWGFLFLVLLAYGIYATAFKPGDKAGNNEAAATGPATLHIVIYTRSSCEPCDRAKAWMTQRQFAFEERNVEVSAVWEEELKNLKSRIVPVIVVNGEPQYGFQSAFLEQALQDVIHPKAAHRR